MNVLLVHPRTDLLLGDSESQDIINSGLPLKVLKGNVTQQDLLRAITSGNFDTIWFVTHGNESGIQLSDGILQTSYLTALVRGRFDNIILNTCSSYLTAQQIQNETEANVIATILSVPDAEAYNTGALLATWLSQGKTLLEAYQLSKPGSNRTYIYLAGTSKKK